MQKADVRIRPWSESYLQVVERLMGEPAVTEHLGGPESPQKFRERHERYYRIADSGKGRMFVIVVGPEETPAGSVGYWEKEWQGDTVWEVGWGVFPEFQGQGIAARATAAAAERKYRFMHAFPSLDNGPSSGICRKVAFTHLGEVDFEYPAGNPIRCNDWRLDLFNDVSEDTPE